MKGVTSGAEVLDKAPHVFPQTFPERLPCLWYLLWEWPHTCDTSGHGTCCRDRKVSSVVAPQLHALCLRHTHLGTDWRLSDTSTKLKPFSFSNRKVNSIKGEKLKRTEPFSITTSYSTGTYGGNVNLY